MAKKKPDDAAAEAERRFKADLKAGTLGSFYIICGEEAFLRSHYVELVTKKLTDGPAGEFNFHRFSADDCTPFCPISRITAACCSSMTRWNLRSTAR